MYPVAEKFVSINGEGRRAGELAVFIRFRGCNLSCGYCDTKWANAQSAPAEYLSEQQLTDYVISTGVINVTLTGGEPLLQKDISSLTDMLISNGRRVEIETNGSVSIADLAARKKRPVFTLDYKLPSSGMESRMLIENYKYLNKEDTVKFVCGDRADLERAAEIIAENELIERSSVYFSPVFGSIEPAEIVEFMKERCINGARVQLQLHKFIWDPEKKGV